MSRRFQFSLKWLFVGTLVVAAFLAGIRFERERQRRADLAAVTDFDDFVPIAVIDPNCAGRVGGLLEKHGIVSIIEGSVVYGVSVVPKHESRASALLRADAAAQGYWVKFK